MKRKIATKTVSFETLRKALIKCLGPDGDKYARILDKVLPINGEWLWPNAESVFTKVKADYYRVKGNFVEDYLR